VNNEDSYHLTKQDLQELDKIKTNGTGGLSLYTTINGLKGILAGNPK
jgi:hypothetical protein